MRPICEFGYEPDPDNAGWFRVFNAADATLALADAEENARVVTDALNTRPALAAVLTAIEAVITEAPRLTKSMKRHLLPTLAFWRLIR